MENLGSRAIIGEFFLALEQHTGASWIDSISMLFTSDQASETYEWIGQSPAMREWIGGRNKKGFNNNNITIDNLHFEATIEVLLKWLRRDKTGQALMRIRELAERTNSHWASLISTLILNGEAQVCYDGQFFFDTDHEEGDSGTQDNDITIDISALPAEVHGTVGAPSPEEMAQVVYKIISQILSFVDDRGEPMNEGAESFLVMVPTHYHHVTANAMTLLRPAGAAVQEKQNLIVQVAQNPRLNTWTDKIVVFRADGTQKPIIRQEETKVRLSAKAEGSDFEHDNDAHEYGVDAWRNVGYGAWQSACLGKLI